jgi:hypothetical protein
MEDPDLPHTHHDERLSDCDLTLMYVDDGRWEIYLKPHGLIGELEEFPATPDEPWLHYRAVLPEMPPWMPEELTDDWRCAVALLVREA